MQHVVKRMQIVIALRADCAQRSFERLGAHWFGRCVLVHGATSIPSKAMSHPATFNGKINWLALGVVTGCTVVFLAPR